MPRGVGHEGHAGGEFVLGGVVSNYADFVFRRVKTIEAERAGGHIVGHQGVDGVAVFGGERHPVGGHAALVAAENEIEIGVAAVEFFPELERRVTELTVDFRPFHAALLVGDVAFFGDGLEADAQVHVCADDGASVAVTLENAGGPRNDGIGGVADKVEDDEVETAGGEQLVAVGVVAKEGGLGGVGGGERAAIPRVVSEAGDGEVGAEEGGAALGFHVVVADGEAEGHHTSEAVEVFLREAPLVGVVNVHDVADVGHEDDALGGDVFADPADVVSENGIRERRGARRFTFCGATIVALGVGDDDDGKRALGRRIEGGRGGVGEGREYESEANDTEAQETGSVHRSSVIPKLIEKS